METLISKDVSGCGEAIGGLVGEEGAWRIFENMLMSLFSSF